MPALEDATAVLRAFTMHEPKLSQAELTRRLGRPKATMSRVMRALREAGLVEYDPKTRLYGPGPRCFELGQLYRLQRDVLDHIQTGLEELCAHCGHSGFVTAFDGADLVVMHMVRGTAPNAIARAPALRVPAVANSNGRAMLSLLSPAELVRRIPATYRVSSSKTPSNRTTLERQLTKIRTEGYARSSNELHAGIGSFGIAFRDRRSDEVFGVAVSFPASPRDTAMEGEIRGGLLALKSRMEQLG